VRSLERKREDRMNRDLRSRIKRKKIREGEKMREMSRRVREAH
jgi:hypothetical protein